MPYTCEVARMQIPQEIPSDVKWVLCGQPATQRIRMKRPVSLAIQAGIPANTDFDRKFYVCDQCASKIHPDYAEFVGTPSPSIRLSIAVSNLVAAIQSLSEEQKIILADVLQKVAEDLNGGTTTNKS